MKRPFKAAMNDAPVKMSAEPVGMAAEPAMVSMANKVIHETSIDSHKPAAPMMEPTAPMLVLNVPPPMSGDVELVPIDRTMSPGSRGAAVVVDEATPDDDAPLTAAGSSDA